MSANSTVTRRRSATGVAAWLEPAPVVAGRGAAAPAPPARAVPHSLQNFAPGLLIAPQLGQPAASVAPHSLQNLAPGMFSEPQLAQITLVLYDRRPAARPVRHCGPAARSRHRPGERRRRPG